MTDFTSITESLTTEPKFMLLMGIIIGIALMKHFNPHCHLSRPKIFPNRLIKPHGKVDKFLCKLLMRGIPLTYYIVTAFFPSILLYAVCEQFGWWGIPLYVSLLLLICYLARGMTQPIFDEFKKAEEEIGMEASN